MLDPCTCSKCPVHGTGKSPADLENEIARERQALAFSNERVQQAISEVLGALGAQSRDAYRLDRALRARDRALERARVEASKEPK